MSQRLTLMFLPVVAFGLSACGYQGPLYLPTQNPPSKTSQATPAANPAASNPSIIATPSSTPSS